MSDTTRVLDEARDMIRKRLAELDDERERLERALTELDGKGRRGRGRPAGRRPGPAPRKGRPQKRRRRKNTRSDEALALIEANPGVGASEVAKQLKIKPNYLYRVLGDLEKEGRVKKQKRQYFPAG